MTIRDIRYNDVWKTGIFLFSFLIGEDLNKEILALEDVTEDKLKNFKIIPEEKTNKLKKYCHQTTMNELLKTLKFVPSERKPLSILLKDLKSLEQ